MRLTVDTVLPLQRNAANQWLELQPPRTLGFGSDRLFIEAGIYENFVCWARETMLRHGVALDESVRLARLLADAATALMFGGGCFVTKAIHATTGDSEKRHVLTLARKNIALAGKPVEAWVIQN